MAVLEARDVVKRYGGVTALGGVSLVLEPGSVHALLGENGAGKSTLVKIICGAVRQDSGEVLLDGKPMHFASTLDAARHGIAVVSQELNLFPDLDVLANMFMMRERLRLGMFDRPRMEAKARPILADLGVEVPVRTPVGELTLADRQLVEVGKALLTDPRVLVLDEPTSALDNKSSDRLLAIMRVLRQRKVAVVFVTHILEEVMQVADQVTIMRDGLVVAAGVDRSSLTLDSIVDGMLGDRRVLLDATVQAQRQERATARIPTDESPASRLVLEDVSIARTLWHVGLTAHVGEIVGLAGIVGAGHRAVLEAIAGMRQPASGSITLPGAKRRKHANSLRVAVKQGVALVSGDRARGVVHESPIWKNVAHVRSMSLGRDGFFPGRRAMRERANLRVKELGIKASDVNQPVGSLSGGNQQKVVLAKWLEADPTVLLLDDPTRGVDVGATAEMHALIRQASKTCPVLLCSTDLDELVTVCDRVIVFNQGSVTAHLSGEDLTRHHLLSAMNAAEPARDAG